MCCLDVIPDNANTVSMYYELRHKYGKRVIPTPCIEYAAILMLIALKVKLTSNLSDFRDILEGTPIKKYADKSLEKYLKRLLNSDVRKCLHNDDKDSNPLHGLFYVSDCTCDIKYSSMCVRRTMTVKGHTLFNCTNFNTSAKFINDMYVNISKALGISDVTIKY